MSKQSPKYLLVVDKLRKQIKEGKLTEQLPGERVLAKEFGYSYMTIRKAIETLVEEGILYKIPTKGTFVSDKSSARKETTVIGYFLDSSIVAGLTSPYYSLIFNALEKEASRLGYSLLYFSDMGESATMNLMNKIDGVIVSCFPRIESLVAELNQHVPVVTIDNQSSNQEIPSVGIDNFNAVSDCVDYLCKLGHTRIGFMTGLEDSNVGTNRYAGYIAGLKAHGKEVDDELIYRGNYSFESGTKGADYFMALQNPPTAIICANDTMAIAAIRKINVSGFSVPEDISVVGFDDITVASQITPPLTTVTAPIQEVAQSATVMLNKLIRNQPLEDKHVQLPASLIVRKTTANARKLARTESLTQGTSLA